MTSLILAAAAAAILSPGAWSIRLVATESDSLQVSFENRGDARIRGSNAIFGVYRGNELIAWAVAPALRYEAIELRPGESTTRTVAWSSLNFSRPRGEPMAPAEVARAMEDGPLSIGLVLSDDKLTVWSNHDRLGAAGDAAALQGIWRANGRTFIFDGDRFRIDGESGDVSFTLDESTEPKRIDFGEGSSAIQGIYEIDGELLRVCTAPPGADRPTRFATAIIARRRP